MIDKTGLSHILSFVTEDSENISERLFERYGSSERIFSADAESLCKAAKNPDTAVFLKLATALAKRRITDSFKFGLTHTVEEIEEYLFAKFFGEFEEKIYALTLDTEGRVTKCALLGTGDIGYVILPSRKIVALCEREGAKGVILAHNHPGGTSEPSEDDILSTRRIYELLESIGVKLCLHYVYSGRDKCTVPF